jgi:hypothetical protein
VVGAGLARELGAVTGTESITEKLVQPTIKVKLFTTIYTFNSRKSTDFRRS